VPASVSIHRDVAGKTHCQIHSRSAFGNFRTIASGSQTLPNPAATSPSYNVRAIIDTGGELPLLLARWREDAARFSKEKAAFEHPGYASKPTARNLQSVK
jgi:hypothetical protein